jgi:hypothetical protein
MFQELGEGTDAIHGEAREALPMVSGVASTLPNLAASQSAAANHFRTAVDQPFNRRQFSASCPQLLYSERTADGGSHGHVDYPP